MAVTGVVGVVMPLDLPERHQGEESVKPEAKDGRRSDDMSKEKLLSDSDGQSRGDDESGENLPQSVSRVGRWSS